MIKFRLLSYMFIVNIMPFLFFDYYLTKSSGSTNFIWLTVINYWKYTQSVIDVLAFISIYLIIQLLLFKFILRNLFNKKFVSSIAD